MTPALCQQPGVVPNDCKGVAEMADRTCSLTECTTIVYCKGLCRYHYDRGRHRRPDRQPCTVAGCDRREYAHGICHLHYQRLRRLGDTFADVPAPILNDDLARITNLIDESDQSGCWRWLGQLDEDGYGRTSFERRKWLAHRAVYTLLTGPIPDGMTLDHLCRNRACVNPGHLEPVTQEENHRRGVEARRAQQETR